MKKEINVLIDSEGLIGSLTVKCIVSKEHDTKNYGLPSFQIETILGVWYDVFDKVSHDMTAFFKSNKKLLERIESLVIETIEQNEQRYFGLEAA